MNHRFFAQGIGESQQQAQSGAAPGIQAGRRSPNQTHQTITQPAYDSGDRKTSLILSGGNTAQSLCQIREYRTI